MTRSRSGVGLMAPASRRRLRVAWEPAERFLRAAGRATAGAPPALPDPAAAGPAVTKGSDPFVALAGKSGLFAGGVTAGSSVSGEEARDRVVRLARAFHLR